MSHQPLTGGSPQPPPGSGLMDEGISNSRTMEGSKNEDMISKVPRDVMACILERMPVQDAVRTSVLSRNWMHKWTSIQKFTFDENFLYYLEHDRSLPTSIYFQIIHYLLLQHDGTIDSFTLYIPDSLLCTTDMYNCLHLLSTKGVKNLTICYDRGLEMHREDDNMVLMPLYSCLKITRLTITNCGFFRPPSFNAFPNLVYLHCASITFCNDSFECLISSCPLLESMILLNCSGPAAFEICSTRLKHLELSLSTESTTKISAKNLKSLYIFPWEEYASPYVPVELLMPLESLQDLYIGELCFDILADVSLFLSLIRAAPNLQDLAIWTCPAQDNVDPVIKLLEVNMNRKLDRLKKVELQIWNGSKDELTLIRLLLALSPSLKVMVLVLDKVDEMTVCKALEDIPRASPMVEVITKVFTVNQW